MDWTALVAQIPVVAVFLWYAIESGKRQSELQAAFMTALDKRDQFYEQRNRALIESINKNTEALSKLIEMSCEHDGWTKVALKNGG